MGSQSSETGLQSQRQKAKKKNKDAKERITCACPCPCCTCKSPCSSSSTCTCTCTSGTCPCTSCTSSRAKRANWTVRLGDQAVPAVQPGPVRHHPLRRVQRGAQRVQAEEPDDSLDFQ